MTDQKRPLDLVGRAAARLDIEGWANPAGEDVPAAQLHSATQEKLEDVSRPVARPDPQKSNGPVAPPFEIDFVSLQKAGFLTPQTLGGRLAEEFRLIKRPLLRIASESRAAGNGMGHVIMVTSAHPEDGKTFISTNLALSMASERDLFVLAIDADIRRMGLSRRLGLTDRRGIMDVLLNPSVSIADVMVRTNIPNFAVIPAGKAMEGATELFASQGMTKLVHDIASRYKDRLILFDTPPVLAASEAGVLASHVGQIAFVLKSGETSKRSITQALRLINVCPNVHFLINRVTQATSDDRFGYYSY